MSAKKFWEGSFGDEYSERNQVDWKIRLPFFKEILEITKPEMILEVGCNKGHNLLAMRHAKPDINVAGIDVNASALNQAKETGAFVIYMDGKDAGSLWEDSFDLVFTAGVLIHIPSKDLKETMNSIVKASKRYVLSIEYFSEKEEEIEYRGHKGKLWKRPFGEMYKKNHGLKLIKSGYLTAEQGFDNCSWDLLEKA